MNLLLKENDGFDLNQDLEIDDKNILFDDKNIIEMDVKNPVNPGDNLIQKKNSIEIVIHPERGLFFI